MFELRRRKQTHPDHLQEVTKFQSSYPPDVSILSYLERIRKYAHCSDSCFVVALIYIDRLIEMRNLVLSSLNIHRIIITAVMVAAKFFDDLFYNNTFYAKLGGVSSSEMNVLEVEFLKMLRFSLFVSEDSYSKYYGELLCYVTAQNSASSSTATVNSQARTSSPPFDVPSSPLSISTQFFGSKENTFFVQPFAGGSSNPSPDHMHMHGTSTFFPSPSTVSFSSSSSSSFSSSSSSSSHSSSSSSFSSSASFHASRFPVEQGHVEHQQVTFAPSAYVPPSIKIDHLFPPPPQFATASSNVFGLSVCV